MSDRQAKINDLYDYLRYLCTKPEYGGYKRPDWREKYEQIKAKIQRIEHNTEVSDE